MKRKISKILIVIIYFFVSLYIIDYSLKGNYNETILKTDYVSHSNVKVIEIPKIKLSLNVSKANDDFSNLNDGLVYYQEFEPNNKIIIFGHSGMGNGTYFNRLDELIKEDLVYIKYDKKLYKYVVERVYKVSKYDVHILNKGKNSKKLLLVTCAKLNKNKRLVVELSQESIKAIEK